MRLLSLREWVCENIPIAVMHASEASFPPSALQMRKNCLVLVLAFLVISAEQDEHNRCRCFFPFIKIDILKSSISKIQHWKLSLTFETLCVATLFSADLRNSYSTSARIAILLLQKKFVTGNYKMIGRALH